jgi:hypothetical protein
MRLTAFLLAEYAGVSQDNKLTIAGTIDEIQVRAFPGETPPNLSGAIPIPHAYLVAQVEFSISEGLRHTGKLGLRDDDGKQVIPQVGLPEMTLAVNQFGRPMRHNSIMRIAGLVVPRIGDYVFELEVDGKVIGECPLYVTDRTGSRA